MANVSGMKVNPPVNRYQEALPKIGIRPIIDGRGQAGDPWKNKQ